MRLIDADALEIRVRSGILKDEIMYLHGVDVNKSIENAPTIEAEPVRYGSWNFTSCSLCGKSFLDYAESDCDKGMYSDLPNYCPNCGAKMDGGAD